MVIEYASLKGTLDGMDTTVITEIKDYFEKEIGYNVPPMTPFIGEAFNQTKAGVHADGLLKDVEIYNIFDTEKLLGKKPLVDMHIGEPIYVDKSLSKREAAEKLQAEAYHIMQVMNGINPGDPTYNTDQNPENYKKTM
jgi:isopropylmalate/homocitrate/citramalate synthase